MCFSLPKQSQRSRSVLLDRFWGFGDFYAPAYLKNNGRALSVTPVRPVRLSVCLSVRPSVRPSVRTSHFRVRAITPKPYSLERKNICLITEKNKVTPSKELTVQTATRLLLKEQSAELQIRRGNWDN